MLLLETTELCSPESHAISYSSVPTVPIIAPSRNTSSGLSLALTQSVGSGGASSGIATSSGNTIMVSPPSSFTISHSAAPSFLRSCNVPEIWFSNPFVTVIASSISMWVAPFLFWFSRPSNPVSFLANGFMSATKVEYENGMARCSESLFSCSASV